MGRAVRDDVELCAYDELLAGVARLDPQQYVPSAYAPVDACSPSGVVASQSAEIAFFDYRPCGAVGLGASPSCDGAASATSSSRHNSMAWLDTVSTSA